MRKPSPSALSIYRLGIWLPLLVPALVIVVARTFEFRLGGRLLWAMLASSLLWAGLPYGLLAVWATWWVGRHSEEEIRRLMLRAPLLMSGTFVPLALICGVAVGAPSQFAAVAVLGVIHILLLGYGYVGIVILLRRGLGPRYVV